MTAAMASEDELRVPLAEVDVLKKMSVSDFEFKRPLSAGQAGMVRRTLPSSAPRVCVFPACFALCSVRHCAVRHLCTPVPLPRAPENPGRGRGRRRTPLRSGCAVGVMSS